MKAIPVKAAGENGYVRCAVVEATHVKLHLPGPAGQIVLPVVLRGKRDGTGCWSWNGDTDSPTLKPSVLISSGCKVAGFDKANDWCWCKYNAEHPEEKPHFHCYRCHTWINDGKAQFLGDCTHEHANKTLDLLEIE